MSLTSSGGGCALGIACIIEIDPQEKRDVTVTTNGQANLLALGEYSVNIQFTNGTNHNGDTIRPINLTVEPADHIPPIVVGPADVTIKAEGLLTDITGKVGEAVAIDNIDGVLQAEPFIGGQPGLGAFGVGEIFIEWRATDSSGNTGNDFQKVTIVDKTPPELTLPPDKTRIVTTMSQLPVFVNIGDATTTDIHDPDTPTLSNDAPTNSMFPLGETFITWTAVDWKGNKRVAVQKITVVLQPGDLAGVELIQTSQDLENSVRLIDGKTTLLRAYFKSLNGRNNTFPGLKLTATRNGQPLSPSVLFPRNFNVISTAFPNVLDLRANPQPADGTNPDGSRLNNGRTRRANLANLASEFILPNDWTTGTVTFSLVFDDFVDVDCANVVGPVNPDCSITKTFALSEEMELKMVTVSFTPSDDSSAPFSTTIQDLINERNHIMAQFPVSEIDATVGAISYPDILQVGFDIFTIDYDGRDLFDDILSSLDDMRDSDSCYETFGDCQRIYYALATNNNGEDLDGDGVFDRTTAIFNKEGGGTVLGLGQNPGRASAGLRGRVGTSGQEIGHNFGMSHTLWKDEGTIFFDGIGPCDAPVSDSDEPFFPYINNVDGSRRSTLGPLLPDKDVVIGWESDRDRMLPIVDASDTMSYCPETAWPSKFTYHRFWSNILAIFGLGASPSSSALSASEFSSSAEVTAESLEFAEAISFVRGFVRHDNEEDEVIFKPTGLLVDPPVAPPMQPAGDFALRRFDQFGALVDEVNFAASHVDYRLSPGSTPIPASDYFSIPFPFNQRVEKVELFHEGHLLGQMEASDNGPEVELMFPNGGETLSGDSVTVTWKGRDRDRDELVYDVQFSPDGGSTWETIIVNYADTSLDVNLNNLPGTDNGLIRVYAKDGFHVAHDTSEGTFIKSNSPPLVSILLPYGNEIIAGEQLLVLKGTSDDREDGHLPDSNLNWTSDIDGLLGNGHNLNVSAASLTPGEHRITLHGEDADGASSSDNRKVLVFGHDLPPMVIAGVNVSPDTLWPINHKMIPIQVEVDVRSIPLPEAPECTITSIVSSEDADGLGDGHTAVDYRITGPLTAEVRAERSGKGGAGNIPSMSNALPTMGRSSLTPAAWAS
ncbi:hypothetical protein QP938_06315 [Porticoccaceae bacterium LTM1]|nr:hypothetical protein QP938_06315 [Porticoccaceae bacterium LTM1]